MSLLGKGAVAMWWDMAAPMKAGFEDWHSHEHFPERLSIPGFLRGSRWRSASGGEGIFVMYELQAYETLASAPYLARLNAPTPWSTQMMPHHRNMVRSQSRVLESRGGGVAGHALTLRFSPAQDDRAALQSSFRQLIDELVMRPGLTGAHLLQHETPNIRKTTEQQIRGGADQVADLVFVVCGYDPEALQALARTELAGAALHALGVVPETFCHLYSLSHSVTPADVS